MSLPFVEFPPDGASYVDAQIQNTQGAAEQKRDVLIWYQGFRLSGRLPKKGVVQGRPVPGWSVVL